MGALQGAVGPISSSSCCRAARVGLSELTWAVPNVGSDVGGEILFPISWKKFRHSLRRSLNFKRDSTPHLPPHESAATSKTRIPPLRA